MARKSSKWTLSVAREEGADQEGWVARIKEVPEFSAAARSQDRAYWLALEHIRMVEALGLNPAPELVAFWNDQNIRNWIACRRLGIVPPFQRIGGSEWISRSDDTVGKFGITQKEFIGILDIDENHIKSVCLKLLDNIAMAKELPNWGETHLARRFKVMSQETIDWLICCMIGAYDWHGETALPIDLLMLIRFRLIPGVSKIEQHGRMMDNRRRAEWTGGSLIAQGKPATFRSVATRMDVQPSTIKRWFESPEEFQKAARRLAPLFLPDGQLKPMFPLDAKPLRQK